MNSQIIGLVTPLTALIFTASFLLLWWRGGMGRHVLGFAVAYLFFGLGYIVTHMIGATSAYVFHVSQIFYTAGAFSVIWAAATRVGHAPPMLELAIAYGVAAITLGVAVAVSDDVVPRLHIVNTGYGAMFIIGTLALLQSRRRETFDRLVILVFAVMAGNFFVRPVLTLLIEQSIPAADYRESVYYSVLNLSLTVFSVATAIVLIGACIADLVGSMREGASRDSVTGLRNRQAFEAEIQELFDIARRRGVPVSLVVADIDHFKQVNDIWGHQAGDRAIAQFGRLVEAQVRDTDISGRIGGEEFCILVWDCDEGAAHGLAERIRQTFALQLVEGLPDNVRLTASFGVSGWQPGESYAELFSRADAALYEAKERGRNQVVSRIAESPVYEGGVALPEARTRAA